MSGWRGALAFVASLKMSVNKFGEKQVYIEKIETVVLKLRLYIKNIENVLKTV